MIKYLGSKRVLIPALSAMASATGAETAVDMFTGTTRVAQAFKKQGLLVTANDIATYSRVLAQCYIEADATAFERAELDSLIRDLNATPGHPGYFTETFCEKARYFQPRNGARVDAIRDRIETELAGSPYYAIALTSLMEAADRVDSTTGLQMAYLKQWAPRAHNDLEMRVPALLDGPGGALGEDANSLAGSLPETDLMYLDPPYNQHRYFTNYHVWETLIRWDDPEAYGVAQKRIDARDEETKSPYNKKREMKDALFDLISRARAKTMIISYNNEAWIEAPEMQAALGEKYEAQAVFSFDHKRYVGAQIGIYNPEGQKVGAPGALRNKENVFVAGDAEVVYEVERAMSAGIP